LCTATPRYISDAFPAARMVGLDLSPYMLAVAAHRDEGQPGAERRTWVHGKGEDTGMADASVDVVSLAFVIHECPETATRALMTEAARILKPGGTFVMTDNNPKSAVIQNLPPALFTLMKSTEPHSNEYYTIDIEGMLRECGFEHVHTEDTDPRHRTVLGTRG
jgi:ubiquinone/menaquinone biosynthesis C-methylase UbiE